MPQRGGPGGVGPYRRFVNVNVNVNGKAESGKNLCGLCVSAVRQSRPRRRGACFAKATEGLWLVMRFFRPSRAGRFLTLLPGLTPFAFFFRPVGAGAS